MDRVSSCSIYVIQQDTQCFMIKFIHKTWWLDMVHPQERFSSCMLQIWCVVICVLLDSPDVMQL